MEETQEDMGDAPTTDVPQFPLQLRADPPPPTRPTRRRRWPRVVGVAAIGALVLVLAAGAVLIALQRSSLRSTRNRVASLQTASAAQQARLQQLEKSLTSVRRSVTGLDGKLASTQAQLQAAQTRLKADEKQLNITAQKLPPDLTALAAQVSPSVVVVGCTTANSSDSGTGFALNLPVPAGYATVVVTAAHVINDCLNPVAQGAISLSTGSQTASVHVQGVDTANDVAVLDTTLHLPALQPSSSAPVAGEFLMAVGNPLGIENNVTSGNVSRVYDNYFLDTAPISNGNSGGPVVDRSGGVVGIVDAGYTADQQAPVVQNLNISLRLSTLCLSLISGPGCSALH